jgi:hypothetical protein
MLSFTQRRMVYWYPKKKGKKCEDSPAEILGLLGAEDTEIICSANGARRISEG